MGTLVIHHAKNSDAGTYSLSAENRNARNRLIWISSYSTPCQITTANCILRPTKCAHVCFPTLVRTKPSRGSSKRRRPKTSTTEVKIMMANAKNKGQRGG